MFRVIALYIIIIVPFLYIHLVTSTTSLPTVMPTSGFTDAESNSTIIIATSLSVIILVLIIVIIILVIIILILYSRIHKISGNTRY